MKYPLSVSHGPAGWCVNDADGEHVARANAEADANAIRDAMNKCAPPPDPKTFPLSVIAPREAWGWAGCFGGFIACGNESTARSTAAVDKIQPIPGRFIPDKLSAAETLAEVCRLLNRLEGWNGKQPTTIPHKARANLDIDITGDVDAKGDAALNWTPELLTTLGEQLREQLGEDCMADTNESDFERARADARGESGVRG